MNELISGLEKTIAYKFKDQTLLSTALTHCSFGQPNNERLEYLGDAILGFVVADTIFEKFPQAKEGELTQLRSSLVKGETLAKLARELNLGDYIKLGAGELKNGGCRRDSILANTLEAIIGAVYLDAGIEACTQYVCSFYNGLLSEISLSKLNKDPKTTLQELLQSQKQKLPVYEVLSEGTLDNQLFTIACVVSALNISVQAVGKSKRVAEQLAAEQALFLLQKSKQNK